MELGCQLLKICQIETRKWLLVLAVVAFTYMLFQSLLIPYGNALQSLVPSRDVPVFDLSEMPLLGPSSKSMVVRNALVVQALSLNNGSVGDAVAKDVDPKDGRGDDGGDTDNGLVMEEESMDNVFDREVDRDVNADDDDEDRVVLEDVNDKNETLVSDGVKVEERHDGPIDRNVTLSLSVSKGNVAEEGALLAEAKSGPEKTTSGSPSVESKMVVSTTITMYSKSNRSSSAASESDSRTSKDNVGIMGNPSRKKIRSGLPPKSITLINEMDRILTRHQWSSHAMRPRWSSARDQEILAARSQIENAPLVVTDRDLYAPLFRNVSKFKRSYDLMERILKVYIYKEGKRPIFHVPILKGLYASEGWFMKLLRESKRFVVKDTKNAHLFYMPFSSRMLEYALYVRNSHNRTNLRVYLKAYSEKIAAKYPYWNRTGGADHFLVACHDWAPYETRHHMEHCIKALCNADVTVGFKLGRDVSLPETYVRSARNPLKDLGGKPLSQRHILAFYAGNIHGYLRPILLKYWKDKDPDMKIYGPMPPGVASKMNYIHHMKSSKYCICPKGYEVNSPRVVEAIFYECVPVIISDNFVPPFFEVLNWGAFAVVLAEKDIPNLKEILLSIPEKKYREMQLGVRKVQRHFLWHAKPRKYDLFHMILHSIWYNRIYQIKPR